MKTYALVIEQDTHAESPREWDNVGTLATFHNRYDFNESEFDSYEAKMLTEDTDYLTLPVYMYDHGGLSVSTKPFSCRWDSGQLGIIYVSKEKARKEWGDISEEKAFEYLDGEVKAWNSYLAGEAHCWRIEDEDGFVIDACGGYIGCEDYAKSEGEAALARETKKLDADAALAQQNLELQYANL